MGRLDAIESAWHCHDSSRSVCSSTGRRRHPYSASSKTAKRAMIFRIPSSNFARKFLDSQLTWEHSHQSTRNWTSTYSAVPYCWSFLWTWRSYCRCWHRLWLQFWSSEQFATTSSSLVQWLRCAGPRPGALPMLPWLLQQYQSCVGFVRQHSCSSSCAGSSSFLTVAVKAWSESAASCCSIQYFAKFTSCLVLRDRTWNSQSFEWCSCYSVMTCS